MNDVEWEKTWEQWRAASETVPGGCPARCLAADVAKIATARRNSRRGATIGLVAAVGVCLGMLGRGWSLGMWSAAPSAGSRIMATTKSVAQEVDLDAIDRELNAARAERWLLRELGSARRERDLWRERELVTRN